MTIEKFKIEVLPIKNKLYRLAKRLLVSKEEAEDTVQEVFLRLWSKKENLDEIRSIEGFAMVITKNLCFDKLKSKRRNTEEISDTKMNVVQKTPYNEMEMTDSINRINKIIKQLPDQQKIIIHLRDVEGYEFEEIAEVTGLTVNTIRVNLSRARKKVRETVLKAESYEFSRN